MSNSGEITFNFLECSNVLLGHSHAVNCLEILNGIVYSGSSDFSIRGWDPTTGKCIRTLNGHTNWVRCLQVLNNVLYSGSADRSICQWDTNTEKCVAVSNEHTSLVRCLQAHNGVLYSGSIDHCIRGWEVESGKWIATLNGHTNWVRCLQIINGALYSGSDDRTIRAWNVERRMCIGTFTGHSSIVLCLQAMNNKRLFSGSRDKTVREWEIETGKCISILEGHTNDVNCLCIFNSILYSGSDDRTVRGWDVSNKTCIMVLNGHTNAVYCLLSYNGSLFSGSADKSIRVWSTLSQSALEPIRLQYTKLMEEQQDKSELITRIKHDYEQEIKRIKYDCDLQLKRKDDKIKKLKDEKKIEMKQKSKEIKLKIIEFSKFQEETTVQLEEKEKKFKDKEKEMNVILMKYNKLLDEKFKLEEELMIYKNIWSNINTSKSYSKLMKLVNEITKDNDINTWNLTNTDKQRDLLQTELNSNLKYKENMNNFNLLINQSQQCDSIINQFMEFQSEIEKYINEQSPSGKDNEINKTGKDNSIVLNKLLGQRDEIRDKCIVSTKSLSNNIGILKEERNKRIEQIENGIKKYEGMIKYKYKIEVEDTGKHITNIINEYNRWRNRIETYKEQRETTEKIVNKLIEEMDKEITIYNSIKQNKVTMTESIMLAIQMLDSLLQNELFEKKQENKYVEYLRTEYKIINNEWTVASNQRIEVEQFIWEKTEIENKLQTNSKLYTSKMKKLDYLLTLDSDDSETLEIDSIKAQIKELELIINQHKKRLVDLCNKAQLFTRCGYPEMILYSNSNINNNNNINNSNNRIVKTGLIIERDLSEFEELEPMTGRNNILLGKLNGKYWILKEFIIGTSYNTIDVNSHKRFEKEVTILSKLNHPLIIQIEGVFYQGFHAYLQMPFYKLGTLYQWLFVAGNSTSKSFSELLEIVYQIIQGISFLHSNYIIHADIKLENIYMNTEKHPIIADFDISKDRRSTNKSSTLVGSGGTFEYLAPELKDPNQEHTYLSDVWALGVVIYKIFFPTNQLVVTLDSTTIPFHDNDLLRDLLEKLLKVNPQERLTAEEALLHPLFTHLSQSQFTILQSIRNLSNNNASEAIKSNLRTKLQLKIDPSNIVESVFDSMANIPSKYLSNATIEIESTIDISLNHVIKEFFSQLFSLPSTCSLFEKPYYSNHFLPLSGELTEEQRKRLEIFGWFFMWCIQNEYIPNTPPLASALMKYIFEIKCTLRDLEIFDSFHFHSLIQLISLPNSDQLQLDFQHLCENGSSTTVTDDNKLKYLDLKVTHDLFTIRKEGMEAVKRGVELVSPNLKNYIKWLDFELLLHNQHYLTVDVLCKLINFTGFSEDSKTPDLVKKWILNLSFINMKKFLLCVTGLHYIPWTGLKNPNIKSPFPRDKITILHKSIGEKLQVMVSYYLLELPDSRESDIEEQLNHIVKETLEPD